MDNFAFVLLGKNATKFLKKIEENQNKKTDFSKQKESYLRIIAKSKK